MIMMMAVGDEKPHGIMISLLLPLLLNCAADPALCAMVGQNTTLITWISAAPYESAQEDVMAMMMGNLSEDFKESIQVGRTVGPFTSTTSVCGM